MCIHYYTTFIDQCQYKNSDLQLYFNESHDMSDFLLQNLTRILLLHITIILN